MNISPLTRHHHDDWLPLWQENCEHQISDEVTAETWRRICHKKEPVFGLGCWQEDKLTGILHYILHPTTGQKEPVCYMQDLYVAEDFRRQGIAKRLVWELHDMGKREHWARIYWLAEGKNVAAQNLYQNLGVKLDFTLHMLGTGA